MFTFFAFLGQAIIGWIIADLIGGFVHWYEDRVAKPNWPILEKYLWEPNRTHHVDPMDFTKTPFWARNSTTFIAATVVGGIWLALFGPSVVLLFAYIGGMVQNEVHYHTHKKATGWILVLQQIGIIQSIPEHSRHHKPPQDRNFCILTNWCNPVLEKLKFWSWLERKLVKTTP
jgi:ubiquitin-conjugating enzyme E2 variant